MDQPPLHAHREPGNGAIGSVLLLRHVREDPRSTQARRVRRRARPEARLAKGPGRTVVLVTTSQRKLDQYERALARRGPEPVDGLRPPRAQILRAETGSVTDSPCAIPRRGKAVACDQRAPAH